MYDLVVIGAGPAGMAAAEVVADHGGTVAVVDAGDQPGGQFHRHRPGEVHGRRLEALYAVAARVDMRYGHRVWTVERAGDRFAVRCVVGQREPASAVVSGRAVLLATGAHDRVVPFPGADLPGVMTAGGAQALLKGGGVVPSGRIVVAGTGVFLLPVAAGLAAAGGRVRGVYEANRPGRRLSSMAGEWGRIAEAGGYASRLVRHRVGFHRGQAVVAAHGRDRLTAVTVARLTANWRVVPGSRRRIECDVLAVGYGFTPQLELAEALGCRLEPGASGDPVVAVSATQRTSVPGVYAAGEVTGVGGASSAELEGRLAGHAVMGVRPPGRLLTGRAQARRFAYRLETAFPVRDGWRSWLTDDTVVCRCESVTWSGVRGAASAGAVDARTVKLLSRAGMGYCQGRVCGYAVNRLVGGDPMSVPVRRPIAQPLPLGLLAEEGEP
ncbi:pyruvate/2-oxoglutarate dehydrogenase complex dihydrolipoamide dehydrogenase (E3) component [Stackebrandtia albiflava]|uniref:Pyruvate/2-oxoglutarate dehydrogenase complex dihydrolipoamide dehydrogenase (E3) component n=1 Tax=Stackebrandtia albiflava TaxID=406432 RepID=A0A562VDB0_9ACTN|nr:NAD(P)/FAD-dependent oxidoreductase [Stackebrandtia albiflava]TWJ15845.1 pyruvate/2-oxoglutarate dehydrogenase complex dihydrolipoamide dehydrogenase (E3) component [Stackebrandtia albiflava]